MRLGRAWQPLCTMRFRDGTVRTLLLILAMSVTGCGVLSNGAAPRVPKIRYDFARCGADAQIAYRQYREGVAELSRYCTFSAAQEYARVACAGLQVVSVHTADVVNTLADATPAACEGARRAVTAADELVRAYAQSAKAAHALKRAADFVDDVAHGGRPPDME